VNTRARGGKKGEKERPKGKNLKNPGWTGSKGKKTKNRADKLGEKPGLLPLKGSSQKDQGKSRCNGKSPFKGEKRGTSFFLGGGGVSLKRGRETDKCLGNSLPSHHLSLGHRALSSYRRTVKYGGGARRSPGKKVRTRDREKKRGTSISRKKVKIKKLLTTRGDPKKKKLEKCTLLWTRMDG